MTRDQAEALALRALAHLAGQEDLLGAFMTSTGAGLEELRRGASDPLFLGAVLDFLMLEDRWVLDFAGASGVPPETVATARAALPGGQMPHWT